MLHARYLHASLISDNVGINVIYLFIYFILIGVLYRATTIFHLFDGG